MITKDIKYYDLTNPQRSIVLTEQFYNNPHISIVGGYIYINQKMDFDKFIEAFNILLKTNDALRIRFSMVDGKLQQYISDYEKLECDVNRITNMEKFENDLKNVTFELLDSPLFLFYPFFDTKNNKYGGVLLMHHAIADAWSVSLEVNRLVHIYESLCNNSTVADANCYSYIDFIQSEQSYLCSDKFDADKTFWEETFDSEVSFGELSIANSFDTKANRVSFDVPKTISDYCVSQKKSPFSIFMAAISIYFSRIFNQENITIGTPVLNRTNFAEKNTSGMFISVAPFLQRIDDNLNIENFISNINSAQFGLLRHQKYPFDKILDYYNKKFSRTKNLYDIIFSYQNARTNFKDTDIACDTHWIFTNHQSEPLAISIFDIDNTGNLQIFYDYLINIFTQENIEDINKRINNIILQIIDNPKMLLKDIDIVTSEEYGTLVKDFNKNKENINSVDTISTLFEKQVKISKDDVALVFDGKEMTYNELNNKANHIAMLLRKNGVVNNSIVGIMINRSFEMIIAMLGVLKAGGAYLPIDPYYPEDRISYILEDSDCSLIITTPLLNTENLKKPKLFIESETLGNAKNLECINTPDDLSYVIYTSGSTGKPKGVMICHKGAVNTLLWRKKEYGFDKDFTVLQIPSFSFDSSVEDIFTPLISGSKLVLLKQNNTNFNLPQIKNLITQYKINHFLVVPSFYNILLDEFSKELVDAKSITVAGEGFSIELVKKHFLKIPNVDLYNEYGPTENTVCSTFYKFLPDDTKVLIGKPITNCSCYVLNKNLKLQPFNVKGELYVSGPGLSKGYIGKEDLTSSRFINNPFLKDTLMYKTGDIVTIDNVGNMAFVERADYQIKYNGFRINLGEIENNIAKCLKNPNVVVLLASTNTKPSLNAYIETTEEIDVDNLKNELKKFLTHYMIPKEIFAIDKFPLTPNGKIDRKKLENTIFISKPKNSTPPRNSLDKKIVSIWQEILKQDNIGIDTNLFDIGGDSLSIISIQSLLFKNGIRIKVQDIFDSPTVRGISDKIINANNELLNNSVKIAPRLYNTDSKDISLEETYTDFRNILLTGSTGFLGAHILAEIIDSTLANVYCIVRNKPNKTTYDRLKEILEYYFESKYTDLIGKRIFIVDGDLSRTNFGVNYSQYSQLLSTIDAIINCASLVKHYGDYKDFYNSNVLSTKNLISFALEAHIPINHISTTSVSGNYLVKNDITCTYTENDFYIGQNYEDNVYVESKFESENEIYTAQQQGLVANIFRMGNIMPRLSDGKFQINTLDNAYYKRILGFLQLGILPTNLKDQEMEFTPVDSSAKAIVALMAFKNKVFHILNNNVVLTSDLINVANKLKKNITFISPEKFKESIKSNNNIIDSFITDLDEKDTLDYSTGIVISNKITNDYLKYKNFKWPIIDENYIKNFLYKMIGGTDEE